LANGKIIEVKLINMLWNSWKSFFVSVITLNGNESRGSGRKIQISPLQQTTYDTPAKEMDNPICDEKQVDDCYQSLLQMKFQRS